MQGRNESNSSVAFQVLIINCQTYKFFQLQLLDVKFLFPEKIYLPQTEENACYGRTSLFLDLKRSWENNLFSSKHKLFFLRYRNLFIKATKMQIPDKRYCTYTVCMFWDAWRASALRYLGLEHLDGLRWKIWGIQVKL